MCRSASRPARAARADDPDRLARLGARLHARPAPLDPRADVAAIAEFPGRLLRRNGGLAAPSGTGRRASTFRGCVDQGRYRPPSPNASPTAVTPAVSAKAKLKMTSSAPASM